MAFSVNKSRPFRSLGLYKSSGKHAAPKGSAPAPRQSAETVSAPAGTPEASSAQAAAEQGPVRHPAHHAATSPRLTTPSTAPAETAEKTAA